MRINPRWLIAGHLLAGCGTSSEDSSMVEELDRIDSTAERYIDIGVLRIINLFYRNSIQHEEEPAYL